jgi:NAD(P)H-quinone oxidoreductase subunit 5
MEIGQWALIGILFLEIGMGLVPFPGSVSTFYRGTTVLVLSSLFLALVLTMFAFSSEQMISLSLVTFHLDRVGLVFFCVVSLIGLVVIAFSRNYLWGDSHQKVFIQKLLYTIALVQILVLSGDFLTFFLAWFFSGLGLRQLLSLYKHRKYAISAARKKIFNAHLSSFFLLCAFLLSFTLSGSFRFSSLFAVIQDQSVKGSPILEVIAFLLVLAAGIKSVNIPFHGWVLGVMEAPTPVSAVLHAGLINAGPFLIIRFHSLIQETPYASAFLVLWGGLSALFGTLVSFYQPAAKTRLSYSSVGHMGFSLMLCGLGLFSAALLHIIGHSFYKAHTFLSTGSEIDKYKLIHTRRLHFSPYSPANLFIGFFLSFLLFAVFLYLFKKTLFPSYAFVVLGVVIAMGVSTFLMHTAIYFRFLKGLINALAYVSFIFASFFLFEWLAEFVVQNPSQEVPVNSLPFFVTSFILLGFLGVSLYSVLLRWRFIRPIGKWDVYIRNGFYLHVFYERFQNLFFPVNERNENSNR